MSWIHACQQWCILAKYVVTPSAASYIGSFFDQDLDITTGRAQPDRPLRKTEFSSKDNAAVPHASLAICLAWLPTAESVHTCHSFLNVFYYSILVFSPQVLKIFFQKSQILSHPRCTLQKELALLLILSPYPAAVLELSTAISMYYIACLYYKYFFQIGKKLYLVLYILRYLRVKMSIVFETLCCICMDA